MQITKYAVMSAGTPHYGARSVDGAPVMLCGTSAANLWRTESEARMCQQCERAHAVFVAGPVERELRLAAGAKGGVGHLLIPGESRGYCGKGLGEQVATGKRVCKNCTRVAEGLDAFSAVTPDLITKRFAALGEQLDVEVPDAPDAFRTAEPAAMAEQLGTLGDLPDTLLAADEQPVVEDAAGTWRDEWIIEGQQTLAGLADEQGALFA
ncbi:hypothetical protein B7P34_04705 [Streptosporangium nondiastaticum]|uniref:Uncharacterized protein n=1 Tax=Streptosporangium nondiastaticum TaxID=35764 RepID=A0A9X7PJ38_9ACTN|nr:hypothetical protein [Streptosporangium nondiastaticum]PSJ29815.1 hypothetical protein B7P34_04705 [Streptosporangium nondiastaticum]